MHILTCTSPIISARSCGSYCNPPSHCSCSCFVGGKPCSALSPRSCYTHVSCFLLLLYLHLRIMLLMLILATGYIPFPSPFSASHPKAGEEGQPVLLSIPGLNLTSHAPWPFPCSTPEINGVQEIRVFFPFLKEARKNICYSSAWECLLFHPIGPFFSD